MAIIAGFETTENVGLPAQPSPPIPVAALPDALPELVFSMLAPLYELFDFFRLPKRLVEKELFSMYRNTFPR
jgi:hypothetical protein